MTTDHNRYNYLSIAEIRFNPIDNLSDLVHAIQVAFVLANYADSAHIMRAWSPQHKTTTPSAATTPRPLGKTNSGLISASKS